MKFFLKTTHINHNSRQLPWSKPVFNIQLVSIAIACENGANFHGVSKEFDADKLSADSFESLPPKSCWDTNNDLRDKIRHFFDMQALTEPVELYGYNCSGCFIALASLWGGPDNYAYSSINLPAKIFDLSQTMYELMDFVTDQYFDDNDFPQTREPSDEPMNVEQKMMRFMSHPDFPALPGGTSTLQEAIWQRDFHDFTENHKAHILLA